MSLINVNSFQSIQINYTNLMEAFNDEFASRANVLVRVSVHKALTFTTAASAGAHWV